LTAGQDAAEHPTALAGMRVVDLGRYWAGSLVGALLADFGADVIKVESIQAPDPWRYGGARHRTVPSKEGVPAYERSAIFNSLNRNKRSVVLNLADPRGNKLFRELAHDADVVVENYSPRIMPKFGLSYKVLSRDNPCLVMASLSGFGATGPWKDFLSFAYPTEAASGMPRFTGYPSGTPMLWGNAGTDAVVGMFGMYGVLLALHARARTGRGQWIDLSQVEALASCLGPQIILEQLTGRSQPLTGNQAADTALAGCVRCDGEDRWLAVSVVDDAAWEALCHVIGRPEWLRDDRFDSPRRRHEHQAELLRGIEEWTKFRDPRQAMIALQKAGVPAGAVQSPGDLLGDPHYLGTGFFEYVYRGGLGNHFYDGAFAKLSVTPSRVTAPAPHFGAHSREILQGMLGCSDAEYDELVRDGITGDIPERQ
jgi:crotonobetainyl-CoA:carnitine CoA-transferase CaiB-like acyl-CoA transferase